MRPRDISEILRHFDELPDSAVVPCRVASLMTGMAPRTLRRQPIPTVPITDSLNGKRVGDIRGLLRERMAARKSEAVS